MTFLNKVWHFNISKDPWKKQTRTSILARTNDKSKYGHQYWQGPLKKANASVNISKDQWKMQNAGINIGKDQWKNKMRASILARTSEKSELPPRELASRELPPRELPPGGPQLGTSWEPVGNQLGTQLRTPKICIRLQRGCILRA